MNPSHFQIRTRRPLRPSFENSHVEQTMSSERRTRSSRANGAQRRSPKTEASKEHSRFNHVKHGTFAKAKILNNEDCEYLQLANANSRMCHRARHEPPRESEQANPIPNPDTRNPPSPLAVIYDRYGDR